MHHLFKSIPLGEKAWLCTEATGSLVYICENERAQTSASSWSILPKIAVSIWSAERQAAGSGVDLSTSKCETLDCRSDVLKYSKRLSTKESKEIPGSPELSSRGTLQHLSPSPPVLGCVRQPVSKLPGAAPLQLFSSTTIPSLAWEAINKNKYRINKTGIFLPEARDPRCRKGHHHPEDSQSHWRKEGEVASRNKNGWRTKLVGEGMDVCVCVCVFSKRGSKNQKFFWEDNWIKVAVVAYIFFSF